ncbi:MAG: hypothetical protein Ct9H300mP28_37410 [Pseudomonadota bacterium]|nr:MAG: hypothetical protein Ct9H300mP28_37410 [Pseudomonadota bacterium]
MVQAHLGHDQFRLYSLIWKRALASQMTAAEIARTKINIEAGQEKEYLFEAQGQRVVFFPDSCRFTPKQTMSSQILSAKKM